MCDNFHIEKGILKIREQTKELQLFEGLKSQWQLVKFAIVLFSEVISLRFAREQ